MILSIITVNLNNIEGLRRTISSVKAQTCSEYEWIIIDGGSDDGSRELIENNSTLFSHWVSEPDSGIYNAMNKGIAASTGKWLLFLNSGDRLYNNRSLESFVASKPDADIVYGNLVLYKDGKEFGKRTFREDVSFKEIFETSLGHCSTFIRRELFLDKRYDESLKIASDWKFFLEQALEGKSFTHLNAFISCFDCSGISCTNPALMAEERRRVTEDVVPKALLNDIYYSDEAENVYSTLRSHWLTRNLLNYLYRILKK